MHWVIEALNSGKDEGWTVIDRRSGVTSLNAQSVVCTFDIQQPGKENEFYRYLRLRQTGKSARNDYNLCFSSLEYFGSVIWSNTEIFYDFCLWNFITKEKKNFRKKKNMA